MNWRDRSGMSLMELLIALVLVAVIAGGLAASTSFGVRLLDRTQSLQETSPQLALRTRLRHWMTTVLPPSQLADFDTPFTGETAKVRFTTLAAAQFSPQSAALRITFEVSETAFALTIDELDEAGNVLNSHARGIAENIQNAKISYFSDNPDEPGWRDTWTDPHRLPTLIKITADAGSTPQWPDFIVNPLFARRN